jgi:hypothetical protein
MIVYKYLMVFLVNGVLLTSCNFERNKKNNDGLIERNFDHFHYVYHFYKNELVGGNVDPASYKPKIFNIGDREQAQLYKKDTLIRFVYKSKSNPSDSSVELFKPAKLENMIPAAIPSDLLGCHFLGIYNSSRIGVPENFYFCFYLNDNDDLLKVAHLYTVGNVAAAFFYTKDSIDPMIRYKNDVAKLLALDRPLNLSDTVRVRMQ